MDLSSPSTSSLLSSSKMDENIIMTKVLNSQLEKNLMILEQDYKLLLFKVQTNMNKVKNFDKH